MNLCSGGRGTNSHDEICHEGSGCPLCEMREELREKITNLETERDDALAERG